MTFFKSRVLNNLRRNKRDGKRSRNGKVFKQFLDAFPSVGWAHLLNPHSLQNKSIATCQYNKSLLWHPILVIRRISSSNSTVINPFHWIVLLVKCFKIILCYVKCYRVFSFQLNICIVKVNTICSSMFYYITRRKYLLIIKFSMPF